MCDERLMTDASTQGDGQELIKRIQEDCSTLQNAIESIKGLF